MSAKRDAAGIVVGGEPRIDFLPPEVKAGKRARKTRRSLFALVVIVLVACVGGYVYATTLVAQSQSALAEEQALTKKLLHQQTQYSEARALANELTAVTNARLVGSATEILWREYLAELQATLPAKMAITALTVDSISATEAAPLPGLPLQNAHVSTLSVTASAENLPAIATWLDSLNKIRGFADKWSSPVVLEGNRYTVDVAVNINTDAFEKRFFAGYEAAVETPVATEEETVEEDVPEGSTEEPTEDSTEGGE